MVGIIKAPKPLQSDPVVTIQFGDSGAEGDIRAYYCRWLGPQPSDPPPDTPATGNGSVPYVECNNKTATMPVTDGHWLFQVKVRGAGGRGVG